MSQAARHGTSLPEGTQELRLPVVHQGRTHYPFLGGIDPENIHFYHHATRQCAPASWQDLIQAGAEAAGCTPLEFLEFLGRQHVSSGATGAAGAPSLPSSGLSAPTLNGDSHVPTGPGALQPS